MVFKIDYDKVSDVGLFFKNKSDELDSLYRDILGLCDSIEENYQSEDSTVYLNRFRNYLKIFLNENKLLRKGGYVLDKTSALYSNQEIDWCNTIVKSDLNKGGRE